jgi:hypothetical protein
MDNERQMKKSILIGILLLTTASVSENPRPRFETVLKENMSEHDAWMLVLHDKETGQEIVCYEHWTYAGGYSPACWLTGRNWK